ncbi:MAG TPA: small-conductance mechanosensitive channel [Jeotgalicoccus aerolatus]|nr:small-conductance mechanosensitive channel [Jeotgalicoccus aerolatus]
MNEFRAASHRWGRITIGLGILISLAMPLYISFVMGYHPGFSLIINSFLAYAAVVAIVWFLEPIMYFPVLGVSGTYVAFFTGNISNMCLPAVASCQEAVGVEPGTDKGEIVGTLGISAASLVNKLILIPVILAGLWLLTVIPESVQEVFPYVLPAIFGAVLAQFAGKYPIYGVLALIIGILVNMAPIPLFTKNVLCIVLLVCIMLAAGKLKSKKA